MVASGGRGIGGPAWSGATGAVGGVAWAAGARACVAAFFPVEAAGLRRFLGGTEGAWACAGVGGVGAAGAAGLVGPAGGGAGGEMVHPGATVDGNGGGSGFEGLAGGD